MVALQISEALAAKLETYAKIEQRPVAVVLENMAARYQPEPAASPEEGSDESASLDAFIGMVEADVTDLSVRAREELHAYFKDKHDRPD
ncbi:MAG: hypothetical protein ACYDBJ_20075 [Aggregatilineales bacterium]